MRYYLLAVLLFCKAVLALDPPTISISSFEQAFPIAQLGLSTSYTCNYNTPYGTNTLDNCIGNTLLSAVNQIRTGNCPLKLVHLHKMYWSALSDFDAFSVVVDGATPTACIPKGQLATVTVVTATTGSEACPNLSQYNNTLTGFCGCNYGYAWNPYAQPSPKCALASQLIAGGAEAVFGQNVLLNNDTYGGNQFLVYDDAPGIQSTTNGFYNIRVGPATGGTVAWSDLNTGVVFPQVTGIQSGSGYGAIPYAGQTYVIDDLGNVYFPPWVSELSCVHACRLTGAIKTTSPIQFYAARTYSVHISGNAQGSNGSQTVKYGIEIY